MKHLLINNSQTEEWFNVRGYVGYYFVSNLGRIRSNSNRARVLKPAISSGYHVVTLYKNGIRENLKVHRIVAESLIPNPENKPCVNHIDGDKLNNSQTNLEWVTYSENTFHAIDNDLLKLRGDKNHKAKFSNAKIAQIRAYYNEKHPTFQELANMLGVRKSTAHKIIKLKSYK